MEGSSNLGVSAALEEMGHPNKAYFVIPHDSELSIVSWPLEVVLEDCVD